MNHITIVSGNSGKIAQYTALLQKYIPGISVESVTVDIIEPQETDLTLISQYKALRAWEHVQSPVLVDDGGHFFESCNNFPGALTKAVWFGLGVEGILRITQDNNRAYREVAVTYCNGPEILHTTTGRVSGTIVPPQEAIDINDPLPYNSIFKPDGFDRVFKDIPIHELGEKDNYRAQAIAAMAQWLSKKA